MEFIREGQWPIVIVNVLAIVGFTALFLTRQNYEFLIYIGVIIALGLLILGTNPKVRYPNGLLWLLTLWAILHMAGGGVMIGEKRLYEVILFPIAGAPYMIFKFDQLVHIIGFGVATGVAYHILRPHLKPHGWVAISIVVVMAGLGLGALNEIIEFLATVLVPETGVGGFENMALDLVADLIGAVMAICVILWHERK